MVAAFKNTIYNLDSDFEVAEAIPGTSDDDIDEQLIPSSDSEQNDDTQDIEDHNLVLMKKNAEGEIEFEEKELNYNLMFSSHFSRASCFAHILQLVARTFDIITSVMILDIDENINWSNSTDVSSESEDEKVKAAMEPPKNRFKHLEAVIARKKEILSSKRPHTGTKLEEQYYCLATV